MGILRSQGFSMHRTAFSIGFTNDQDTIVCKCICMLLVSWVQAVEILKIASLNDGNCIFRTFPHISLKKIHWVPSYIIHQH